MTDMIAFALANALAIPLPANSVQMIATSPPYYGLRDYGIDGQIGLELSPAEYIAKLVEAGREWWRVLKPDGTLWLNLGDSYAGSGKGRGGGGRGPSSGKQLTNRDAYFDTHSLDRRAEVSEGLTGKQLMMIPARVAIALQDDGWWLRSEIVWAKPNPMPESVTDRPTRSHEMIYLLAKQKRYYYDADAVKEIAATGWRGSSFTNERDQATKPGLGMGPRNGNGGGNYSKRTAEAQLNHGGESHREDTGFRNLRDVWTVTPQGFTGKVEKRQDHFAVWPEKLVEIMVKAGSKPGDLLLDPFAGSGTTGRVCARLGRRFVGLDLNPEYFKLAAERTDQVQMTIEAVGETR